MLAPAVKAALPRHRAIPSRSIEKKTDGPVLSQYARISPVRHVTLRTLNVDMLCWFAAGLDTPVVATLDARIPPVLASAGAEIVGNFTFKATDVLAQDASAHSAIFGDRADIVEFVEAIREDILSGRHAYLYLYSVLDVAGRKFVESARAKNIDVELIPGPSSFAVFDLQPVGANSIVAVLLLNYVERVKMAPGYLEPTLGAGGGEQRLTGALGALLNWTWESSAAANDALHLPGSRPGISPQQRDFRNEALALAEEVCAVLDPKRNPISAITGMAFREQANAARDELRQMLSDRASVAKMRGKLFESYRTLWEFYHLVVGVGAHSLARNETIRLALERAADCVIAPKSFKPFREYVFFYRFKDFHARQSSSRAPSHVFDRSQLEGSINHYVRYWQLLGLIEMLFAIIRRERPEETIRWLDLGCARGIVANAVRLEEILPDGNWEIIGVDWNEAAVEIANKRAGPRRTFLVGDVKEAIARVGSKTFNIISGFEFAEHLEDPVKTLRDYVPICSDFFIAGSPLAELQGWMPAAEHVWTFDRKGYQEIFRAAGLTPTLANESYVGSFVKGHDWVTVISGVNRTLPTRITSNNSSPDESSE